MKLSWLKPEAFPFGPGLFETILWRQNFPVFFKEHWERLSNSCKALGWPFSFSPEETANEITLISKKFPPGNYKLRLIYQKEPYPCGLAAQFLPLTPRTTPAVLIPKTVKQRPGACYKTTEREDVEKLYQSALRGGGTDALLITAAGEVLETTRANLFAVTNGRLFTPPLNGKILPGITRSKVIQLAKISAIPASETGMDLQELLKADEIFITNSIVGIKLIGEIFGLWKAKLPTGKMTETLAQKLMKAQTF